MAEPGPHSAFFYGTLMAPAVLHNVVFGTSNCTQAQKDQFTVTPAVLHEYCRYKVSYADYPGIIPVAGQSVRGTYVTGFTMSNIFNLDVFEGGYYTRSEVEVELVEGPDKGKKVKTQTYVWTSGEDSLDKEEWSFDVFVKDRLEYWYDGSEEYADLDNPAKDNQTTTTDEKAKKDVDKELDTHKEVMNSAV